MKTPRRVLRSHPELRVQQPGDGWVIGAVAVESLAALAEEPGIERVELP